MKLFQTTDINTVKDCQKYLPVSFQAPLSKNELKELQSRVDRGHLKAYAYTTDSTIFNV